MEAGGLSGGKAERQRLQRETKNWGQVKTEKGRGLYWITNRQGLNRRRNQPKTSLHCTGKLTRGRSKFPVIPAASTTDSILWSRIMMYKFLYKMFLYKSLPYKTFKRQDKEKCRH